MRRTAAAGAALVAGWYVWQRVVSMTTVPLFADLVAGLARPEPGMEIYDPSAGSGVLLAAAHRRARRCHGRASPVGAFDGPHLFGQELDRLSYLVGRAHLGAMRLHADYRHGNTLLAPAFLTAGQLRRFDRVVANPEWEQAVPPEVFTEDRLGRYVFGVPPAECADWGWMQHILASVGDGGRMAVVLDAGALSRSAPALDGGSELEIRRRFVEADLIETVLWCGYSEAYTGSTAIDRLIGPKLAQSAIIVASREKRQPGRTLMINPAPLVRGHLLSPASVIQQLLDINDQQLEQADVSILVDGEQIVDSGADLRPTTYLGPSSSRSQRPALHSSSNDKL